VGLRATAAALGPAEAGRGGREGVALMANICVWLPKGGMRIADRGREVEEIEQVQNGAIWAGARIVQRIPACALAETSLQHAAGEMRQQQQSNFRRAAMLTIQLSHPCVWPPLVLLPLP
jgi:hypothetical protein